MTRRQVKWRYALCILLLASIIFSCMLPTVCAFDLDTHYFLKYYLLRKVGFTKEEAALIAKADVSTDYGDTEPGFAYDHNNPLWHALASKEKNDARQTELWNRAKDALKKGTLEEKLIPFGQFLHFLEDRTAHEGYGWFWGHAFDGHVVDYLSHYDLATLQSAIENWMDFMKQFHTLLKGVAPNPVTWDDVKNTVNKTRNANPTPKFWSSPDSSKAKDAINDALKNEVDPNESINSTDYFKFNKNGDKVSMIFPQQFSYATVALERNNVTILDAMAVIESSSYLPYHPEALDAIEKLRDFMDEQDTVDPPIDPLRNAVVNMTGLAQDDPTVLNETTHVCLLMLDSDFTRERHVLYLRSLKGVSGAGMEMENAYDMLELAEPEIVKMGSSPSDVDFDSLGGYLYSAWRCIRDAELSALEGGVGGIVAPVDKIGLLAPYVGLASAIIAAAVATTIYVKRVKQRKERQ